MKFFLAVLSLLTFSFAEFINDSPLQSPCQPSSISHLSDIAKFSMLQEHKNAIHLKEPRLIVYVQTFKTPDGKPLSLLPLLENETKVTHVILASMHLHEEPGIIKLNDDLFNSPHWDSIWHEVELLQKHGVKVMGLLGGAAKGTYVNLNGTEREFYAHYHPLLKLIKKHKLDGLDIDIEEDVDVSVPLRLLNALRRDMGPSFLLTMAPIASALISEESQNLSGFSYFELDALATVPGSDRKLVDWYNAQHYGHFSKGPPHYEELMRAGWDPQRVVMGVLDCVDNGQPNNYIELGRLRGMLLDLREEYNGFGGVAGWEYYNAGLSYGAVMEPWEWVKKIGEALYHTLEGKESRTEKAEL